MSDTISRQAVIDLLKQMRKDGDMVPWEGKDVFARIRELPAEPHWIPVTKEEMFKAGYEGREIRFRVDGRLFTIRELAQ